MEEKPIILFDGVCNFCNSAVQFIIKHDKQGIFQFASLQSSIGKELIETNPALKDIDSVILLQNGIIKTESTAALHISKKLNGWPKFFYIFIIIPAPIRNYFYQLFASNRYRFFGKSETCMIPTKEIRDRFLS
ncbi:thiol-disulfide oxidoreductase DCC family protein [Gottfriedia solisilvae]|uniref:Thiol-disulfide oxidoreductase n=1 Tax=Gottfriedia solisilvae TaxID=1516104 RepID=A0A8J3AFB9_9BACI|nr:DCC1-like thiol-disulfide oxidoreductase family protein [Gottfriedia solisilvae]GGI11426.1 thiol-disulfide oxidoreductase [Gottfriedia solisilvae]